ncbi:MAG: hypothetical protein CI949_1420 [Halanaerobium sp.]|nr:MAG: hypothetical protein CI949_1420 [Halanaerobium sp.]
MSPKNFERGPSKPQAEIHLLSCQLKVKRVSLNGRQPSLPGAEVLASSRDNLLFNEIKTGGTAISIALTKGRFFVFLEKKIFISTKTDRFTVRAHEQSQTNINKKVF